MTATLEQVQQALRDVVAEFGPDHRAPRVVYDHKYGSMGCRYVIEDAPSCIAAQVCLRLNLASVEGMKFWDTQGIYQCGVSIGETGIDVEPEARRLLTRAQSFQDDIGDDDVNYGVPWGVVLGYIGL